MKRLQKGFQYLSYLQYAFQFAALAYICKLFFNPISATLVLDCATKTLLFLGIAISFTSLQDVTKTQNTFSKKIWQHPKKGKVALLLLASSAMLYMILGMILYLLDFSDEIHEIGISLVVLGIGQIGVLKTGSEMYAYHQSEQK